jgi:hypothetical protein
METSRWINDVRYADVTSPTINYETDLDAFHVARAEIRSPSHPHHLGLVVTVTIRDLSANRLTLDEAIVFGRTLLDRLIVQHRADVESLEAHAERVFDFTGTRLR